MANEKARFRFILKSHGYQITRAREAVFEVLLHVEPLTINEIIKKTHGMVDRVSVYRNLDLFERLGIAQRIHIGWKYKVELSDQFTGHHHHMSCLTCGKTIDIEDEYHIDEFIASVAKKFEFQPRSHHFEIDGYCKNCQKVTR